MIYVSNNVYDLEDAEIQDAVPFLTLPTSGKIH